MTEQTSLLDILAEVDPDPSPAVDMQRGYRPKYERCPDCGQMAYGSIYEGRLRSFKILGVGWLTLNSCRCGRYQWRSLYVGGLRLRAAEFGEYLPLDLPHSLVIGVDR